MGRSHKQFRGGFDDDYEYDSEGEEYVRDQRRVEQIAKLRKERKNRERLKYETGTEE